MRRALTLLFALVAMTFSPGVGQAKHQIIRPHGITRHYFGGATRVTQYLPTGNPTASGIYPYWGELAAPYWVPLYAHVTVPGVGRFVVLDRGLLGSNQVDIFVWRVTRTIPDYAQGVFWQ